MFFWRNLSVADDISCLKTKCRFDTKVWNKRPRADFDNVQKRRVWNVNKWEKCEVHIMNQKNTKMNQALFIGTKKWLFGQYYVVDFCFDKVKNF